MPEEMPHWCRGQVFLGGNRGETREEREKIGKKLDATAEHRYPFDIRHEALSTLVGDLVGEVPSAVFSSLKTKTLTFDFRGTRKELERLEKYFKEDPEKGWIEEGCDSEFFPACAFVSED